MVMGLAWVAVRPVESTTFRVKLKIPAAVGVPVIAPPEESDNPAGDGPPRLRRAERAVLELKDVIGGSHWSPNRRPHR